MFAGIVEDAGKVLSLEERTEAWLLELALPFADGDGAPPKVENLRSAIGRRPMARQRREVRANMPKNRSRP